MSASKYCTDFENQAGLLQTVTDVERQLPLSKRILTFYYAATALFLLLDYVFHVNVRVAFLDPWPAWRAAYYAACLALFAAMVWRPGWAELLGIAESLFTLSALILTTGVRVMVVTDEMIDSGTGFVTAQELVNFVIAGGIAWLSWQRGMLALSGKPLI